MVKFLNEIIQGMGRVFISGTYENLKFHKNSILTNFKNKPICKDLYISLTTYEPRLNSFEFTILSILAGNLLPEKILIYVPLGFKSMVLNNPNSFIKNLLIDEFIEMIEMEEDLGCHSKYFYSFKDFGKSKDIVICDDDIVYYKNWLKDLVSAKLNFPNYDIFAFKAVQVFKSPSNSKILPYNDWHHLNKKTTTGTSLYAEGVGGVLFKRSKLVAEVLNKTVFLELTPKADDVWLWYCSVYNSLSIKFILPSKRSKLLYVIPKSQEVNLWNENTILKRNDLFIENCRLYFKNNLQFDILEKLPSKME